MVYSTVVIVLVTVTMLSCILIAMIINEGGEYGFSESHNFALFFIKFPCALALHLMLYPEVARGMIIMKYANNEPDKFVEGGSETAFLIGMTQCLLAISAEFVNITLLSFQHTIYHAIQHFVALEVIVEVCTMYFESQMDNKLKPIMHHPPKQEKLGRNIKFASRSTFHKFARTFYKVFRCFYVSTVFYFMPFSVIIL